MSRTAEPGDRDDGSFGLALPLAALAGWVDTAGLHESGGVFLSFMSGNTTELSVSLARQDWARAGMIGVIVVLFVGGVAAGETIEPWGGRHGQTLVLGVEATLLCIGALLHWPGSSAIPTAVALFPLVFAMGLQNATMHRAGGIGIGLTYVTGTLVQIGRAVGRGGNRGHLGQYVGLWMSLAAGAGLGALVLSVSTLAALAVAAGGAAVLAIIAAWWR